MAVSFEHIPANIRVPLFYVEINNALAGYQQMDQPALLIGPVSEGNDANAAPLDAPVLVVSTDQAYSMFGTGSVLADMVATYRKNDSYGELWCIPTSPSSGEVAATGTITVAGSPTQAGTIPLYIGGDLVRVNVPAGASADDVATAIDAAVNANPLLLTTAEAAAAVVTLTAQQPGELGNEISITLAYQGVTGGERIPPGITLTIAPMTGGAGVPDLTNAIAAMGDDIYDFIAFPWTDAASLNAIGQALDDFTGRWAWDRQVYGHAFSAKTDTAQNLLTFGKTRNDQHVSVLAYAASPSPPWRRAASFAAEAAMGFRNDPARPLQTLPLIGNLPPNRKDKFSISTRNSLLYAGLADEDEVSGTVRIARAATTYQKNAWGQPDPSYLDATTPFTIMYFVRYMKNRLVQKFPRSKLADDGTSFGPGQAVVTPRIIKAELIAAYSELETAGIVENIDSFKQLLIVERDANDPNRVNIMASPDLINQLRIIAMMVAFRLQTAPTPAAAA